MGQYFTSEALCDLTVAFCIRSSKDLALDPTCGTGTFNIRSYDRLRWLEGRLPAPHPLGFTPHGEVGALLMSAIEGEDLAQLCASLSPQIIVTRWPISMR